MELTINGEAHHFDDSHTVTSLLATLKVDTRQVAVERNLEIIPKSLYDSTDVCDKDILEIVEFIGGG